MTKADKNQKRPRHGSESSYRQSPSLAESIDRFRDESSPADEAPWSPIQERTRPQVVSNHIMSPSCSPVSELQEPDLPDSPASSTTSLSDCSSSSSSPETRPRECLRSPSVMFARSSPADEVIDEQYQLRVRDESVITEPALLEQVLYNSLMAVLEAAAAIRHFARPWDRWVWDPSNWRY